MSDSFLHKKSLGQHFLNSAVVPGWMCDAAEIQPGDRVLEIGPGTGALTRTLLERGAEVLALEADARAITRLEETFADAIATQQLSVLEYDVRELTLNPTLIAQPYKIVSNIPYYLSGLLFRRCLDTDHQPSDLIFLVQKEVAKRATANLSGGEKGSLLSLSTQVFGETKYVKTVSSGHFTPPPKVDSAIISVRNISRDKLSTATAKTFFAVLHMGFGQKRKQLQSTLKPFFPAEAILHSFSTAGVERTVRAEDVSLEQWLILVENLYPHLVT